ncbi:hypothetical protein HanRHA438_Chr09g0400581 [Helianthus annuus]|nr:hypothetical protein HanIR_Chr09g0419391 [Helianthus annuus]KAJ0888306.1 hypothetical protein HanRHA438_Chr09g0400581 [Helianthus annuus]
MKWGLEMREFHVFETDLKRARDLGGNRGSIIASVISRGRFLQAEGDIASDSTICIYSTTNACMYVCIQNAKLILVLQTCLVIGETLVQETVYKIATSLL